MPVAEIRLGPLKDPPKVPPRLISLTCNTPSGNEKPGVYDAAECLERTCVLMVVPWQSWGRGQR